MPLDPLGRYEILDELGRGAMGIVYKARDPLIDRVVAIKSIDLDVSLEEAEAFEHRFFREAKSAGRLNHINIVTIHDVGRSGDNAYIAMEFLEGRSLREVIDSGVVLPQEQIADIAAQVAEGLACAHINGVVHRDIKPANVMLLDSGIVKITDFGIALLPRGSRTIGGVFGSPKYISPEQVVGNEVDGRSDIFALGAVLYELLTGSPAFTASDLDAILDQVINDLPPPPSTRNRNIGVGFDRIVAKAMAKRPDDRYSNADDMAWELRNYRNLAEPAEVKESQRTLERNARRQAASERVVATPEVTDVAPTAVAALAAVETVPQAAAPSSRRPVLLGGAAALLAVVFVAWAITHKTPRIPEQAPVQTATLVPATAAVPKTDAVPIAKAAPGPLDSVKANPEPGTTEANAAIAAMPPDAKHGPAPAQITTPVVALASPETTESEHDVPGAPERANSNVPSQAHAVPVAPPPASRKPPAPPHTARLAFAITPWGEVYVDGRRRGVSPPLREIKLSPGKHVVEIRNSKFKRHSQTVTLVADASMRIKHKFQ
jgi:hypothetical protein